MGFAICCPCFGPSKEQRREEDRLASEQARARAAEAAQKRQLIPSLISISMKLRSTWWLNCFFFIFLDPLSSIDWFLHWMFLIYVESPRRLRSLDMYIVLTLAMRLYFKWCRIVEFLVPFFLISNITRSCNLVVATIQICWLMKTSYYFFFKFVLFVYNDVLFGFSPELVFSWVWRWKEGLGALCRMSTEFLGFTRQCAWIKGVGGLYELVLWIYRGPLKCILLIVNEYPHFTQVNSE